jgi:hypothetical protein
MNNLQNSASERFSVSARLSNKEKFQNQMKPKGPLTIMTTNTAIPSQCIALTLMVTGPQRTGRRILGHLRKKETQRPLIRDSLSTIREAVHQTVATVEAHTHSDLHTICSTAVRPAIAPKIAPYSSSPREKWTRDRTTHRHNQHPEKSTTPHNGLPITSNTLHLTLRIFHHKPIKTIRPKPRTITNHTIMSQPIIHNLCQLHK